MGRSRRSVAVLAAGVVVALSANCVAKERQAVTVSYVVAPEKPLPEGLKAVAVIDSGVKTAGVQQDERERKWSTIAADMIEAMLQNAAPWGSRLSVANRRETKKILTEQDLRLAGMIDGVTAVRAGKLLDVQGLVTSRITINIEVQRGTKSSIDWMTLMGGVVSQLNEQRENRQRVQPRAYHDPRYVHNPRDVYARSPRYAQDPRRVYRRVPPYPGPPPVVVAPSPVYPPPGSVYPAPGPAGVPPEPIPPSPPGFRAPTKDVQEVSRHLTVQCAFSLMDAATGEAILQYAPPPYRKKDQASPDFLFGRSVDEADLDPVDHFIGELIERATQEFVGMMAPIRAEVTYELVGRHEKGEAGIRALRADDYAVAMQCFEQELRKEPDEHEAVFAMGVTCELMGDPSRALDYYRRAASMEDVGKEALPIYLAAKDRLASHLHRILVPGPPASSENSSSGPAPASAATPSSPTTSSALDGR